MPELPEVEAARHLLEPVMLGATFDRVAVRRANLRRDFPPEFAVRLTGATVRTVTRRGKYLLLDLSTGETLV
ncbi:MAG: DNA-formamidopyrimidine glycosylase family protein, partial [Luteitalea sp.]